MSMEPIALEAKRLQFGDLAETSFLDGKAGWVTSFGGSAFVEVAPGVWEFHDGMAAIIDPKTKQFKKHGYVVKIPVTVGTPLFQLLKIAKKVDDFTKLEHPAELFRMDQEVVLVRNGCRWAARIDGKAQPGISKTRDVTFVHL